MKDLTQIDVSYQLLIFNSPRENVPSSRLPKISKGTPYFFDIDLEISPLPSIQLNIDGVNVDVRVQVIDQKVTACDCRYTLTDLDSQNLIPSHHKLRQSLKTQLLEKLGNKSTDLFEEYVAIMVPNNDTTPEKILAKHSKLFISLIRATDQPLDKSESQSVLSTRVCYSAKDMTVVDWEGAVIIAADSDFDSDVELFKIGNFQLLCYRYLDRQLDSQLTQIQDLISKRNLSWLRNRNQLIYSIVEKRLSIILSFEKTEQSLLLIGDWYSAKLYQKISDEFYLNSWKTSVKDKLDSLGEIQETVTQNLTLSWAKILDLIQIGGWLVLLIGYFILFFLDVSPKLHG
jgi:hypothetical protein